MARTFDPDKRDKAKRKLTARRPASVSAEVGLDELYWKLLVCANFYQERDDDGRRVAVVNALEAVIAFLQKQGFPPVVLDPVDRPVKALVSLDNNAIDPLFATRMRPGKPTRAIWDTYRSAVIGYLANLWLLAKEGDDRTHQAKLSEAASKMRGDWFGTVTLAQVKSARQALSEAAKDDPIKRMAEDYHEALRGKWADQSAETAFYRAIEQQNALPRFDLAWRPILKTPPVSSNEQD